MAKRSRKSKRWKRSVVYPCVGFLLSFSAPIGWLVACLGTSLLFHPFRTFPAILGELREHTFLYVYMHIGAVFTLTLCGLLLGIRDDRIQEHYNKLLSQRRLLRIKNRQLSKLSITDRLTGLANYFRLQEVLASEYKRARRYNLELCVLLVDIDHFKKVNDTFGHLFGDFVLHELGQIFAASRRESDYVARSGGEEFCFILTQTNINDAIRFAERLRDTVAKHDFEYKGMRQEVTLSAGIASITALPSEEGDENGQRLVAMADEALYDAKRRGRNRVERYRLKPVGVPARA